MVRLFISKKEVKTNLSNTANLGETICCGPWMAAASQYSLTWRSNILKMLTIFEIIASMWEKIIV